MRITLRTIIGFIFAAFGERVRDSAEVDRLHAEMLLRRANHRHEMGERLYRQAVAVMELSDIVVESVNEPEEEPEDEEAVH